MRFKFYQEKLKKLENNKRKQEIKELIFKKNSKNLMRRLIKFHKLSKIYISKKTR